MHQAGKAADSSVQFAHEQKLRTSSIDESDRSKRM